MTLFVFFFLSLYVLTSSFSLGKTANIAKLHGEAPAGSRDGHDSIVNLRVEEWNSNNIEKESTYIFENCHIVTKIRKTTNKFSLLSFLTNWKVVLGKIFLPVGYPHSVPVEYPTFQKYNLLQDLCSYLRNIMATHAIFVSIGVGSKDSHALAATLQWILRDGISMLVGLIFTSINSQQFGLNVKSWRLFADFINNVGITFDMIAPFFPKRSLFLLIISLGSICKCLCGIAAGATNAAIFQYFSAKNNNIADILSKNHAQHNIVSLLGLGLTMTITHYFPVFEKMVISFFSNDLFQFIIPVGLRNCIVEKTVSDNLRSIFIWGSYVFLTGVHMYCNYRAVKVIALNTINYSRYRLLLKEYFSIVPTSDLQFRSLDPTHDLFKSADRFSPDNIARKESVFTFLSSRKNWSSNPGDLRVGISFQEAEKICGKSFSSLFADALNFYSKENYVIIWVEDTCIILYSRAASSLDHAKSIFEALFRSERKSKSPDHDLSFARAVIDEAFSSFWNFLLRQGWSEHGSFLLPSTRSFSFEVDSRKSRMSSPFN